MSRVAPHIPENAPFSAEQRQWLNGLLAGLFLSAAETGSESSALQVTVLFASQSGTAERLAKKMAKRLKGEGHSVMVQPVEKMAAAELAQLQNAVFFASTYGDGEPPESAQQFRELLFAAHAPRLEHLRYAVFCLGDQSYEHFCRFGIDLDERLHALGATRLLARMESDVDVDGPFDSWSSQLATHLQKQKTNAQPDANGGLTAKRYAAAESRSTHTRENPFHAEIVDKRVLTHPSSSKETLHVTFDLADGEMQYEAGDACGVLAENDPAVVAEILDALPFPASDIVNLPKVGAVTLEHALRRHLQPTRLTRKMTQAFAARSRCATLNSMLTTGTVELDAYMHGRGLIDLLHAYPGAIATAAEVVEILPRLSPRLYSISSSPAAHGRELHCTVGVIRYHSHGRERGGVASTMLAHRMDVGARVPIYLQPNKRFRLPSDPAAPIIMIGPGTGIAPFRAFLHERQAFGHPGRNWLFFGERSATTDFLYCRELKQFADDGHLSRLDTAFSRDQAHKIYVQDRMLESGAEFFRWLQDGASLYVCGDASRMAKDVDATLHRIVETHGGMSPDAAQEYVSGLQEKHRYHRDVY